MATSVEQQPQYSAPQSSSPRRRSSGPGTVIAFLGILFLAVGAVAVWLIASGGDDEGDAKGTTTYTAERGPMLITVTDDGNVESASNIDLKCEIAGGSTILWIVEDGKIVEEGDELATLDTAVIENQLTLQRSTYERALAAQIQSQQAFEAAELAIEAYKEGTFVQELQLAESAIKIAEQNLSSAKNTLDFTDRMVRKGFATPLQREADEFAVQRAEFDLEAAETAKRVLEDFTYKSMVKTLEAAAEAAEAQARADSAALKNEEEQLKFLEEQLNKCVIVAPKSGMVVYANDNSRRRSSSEPEVAEGAAVRERQTVIRLPDLTTMQVKVTVHESKVDRIKPGMPARIVIQGQEYPGVVMSIANQPEPTGFFSAEVKEYATVVAIDGETKGLRPGMTAEVEIMLDSVKDAITLPVSCVVQQRGAFYCWVKTDGKIERRPLQLGRTNDVHIEVVDGVAVGDVVIRNPRAVVPEAREETPLQGDEADASKFGEPREIIPPPARPSSAGGGGNLMQFDTDGSGTVSLEEAPEWLKGNFSAIDSNGDGEVDETEAAAARARRGPGGPGGAGGPNGGGPRGGGPGGAGRPGGGPGGGPS